MVLISALYLSESYDNMVMKVKDAIYFTAEEKNILYWILISMRDFLLPMYEWSDYV